MKPVCSVSSVIDRFVVKEVVRCSCGLMLFDINEMDHVVSAEPEDNLISSWVHLLNKWFIKKNI